MESISIGLDVGGTFIKGAVLTEKKNEYMNVHYYESKSKESKETILANFLFIINDLLFDIENIEKVEKISFAFPGPFDYDNGISLIKNLRKFDQVYGINLKKEIKKMLIAEKSSLFEETQLTFLNDVEAFAIGENKFSKVAKGAYFTIGTGLGSTFIENKNIVYGKYSIPSSGMIYAEPFKDSTIDHYICERGLIEIGVQQGFDKLNGEDLFYQAESGVEEALKVFEEFGQMIGKAIKPFVTEMNPDEIVFGGQVSKSFKYFREGIKKELSTNSSIHLRESINTTMRTLEGLN